MPETNKPGTVYLVGAGPGDPELLTLRGRSLIQSVDVLVYDYLANAKMLDWADPTAEKVYVGKQAGRHSIPQEEIQEILRDRASKGLSVVRLKGGDPFVFARGGEEIRFLADQRIPFEIVPGVTSALAAAAYVGIPLSHRDHSSEIVLLTGHENPEKQTLPIDFRRFSRSATTVCIYMGMKQLPRIVRELKEGGLPEDTPAAVVQWATLNRQRSVFATLATLPEAAENAGLGAPAIVIIGDVVGCRAGGDWFEGRPLFGRRIVVTRAREQAGQLTALLESKGAEVIELPFIEVTPSFDSTVLGEVFAGLAEYEWIVFTSTNGVRTFFDLFHRAFADIRSLGPMRIAAVGPGTARAIKEQKLQVDLRPETSNADALADALIQTESLDSVKVLVVTGSRNRETLVKRLEEEAQAIVDTLPLYETERTDLRTDPNAARFREEGADAVLFTSSSTVRSFVEQSEALQPAPGATPPLYGSIGPLTSEAMRGNELPVAFEAPEANLGAFVEALANHFQEANDSGS